MEYAILIRIFIVPEIVAAEETNCLDLMTFRRGNCQIYILVNQGVDNPIFTDHRFVFHGNENIFIRFLNYRNLPVAV